MCFQNLDMISLPFDQVMTRPSADTSHLQDCLNLILSPVIVVVYLNVVCCFFEKGHVKRLDVRGS